VGASARHTCKCQNPAVYIRVSPDPPPRRCGSR